MTNHEPSIERANEQLKFSVVLRDGTEVDVLANRGRGVLLAHAAEGHHWHQVVFSGDEAQVIADQLLEASRFARENEGSVRFSV